MHMFMDLMVERISRDTHRHPMIRNIAALRRRHPTMNMMIELHINLLPDRKTVLKESTIHRRTFLAKNIPKLRYSYWKRMLGLLCLIFHRLILSNGSIAMNIGSSMNHVRS